MDPIRKTKRNQKVRVPDVVFLQPILVELPPKKKGKWALLGDLVILATGFLLLGELAKIRFWARNWMLNRRSCSETAQVQGGLANID